MSGLRILFYIKSPDVLFLADRAGAQWIKYDSEFELEAKQSSQTKCDFKYIFNIGKKVDNAVISVQALKRARVFVNGVEVFSSTPELNKWKQIHDIKLPFTVESGLHEIMISVVSENSHPAVIAYSETLAVRTGENWLASDDGETWKMAVPVSEIKQSVISKKFSSSINSLIAILPYLAGVFLIIFIISLFPNRPNLIGEKYFYRSIEPHCVRWILMFLWGVLSLNNMFNLNFQVGTDGWGHIEYIDYIVTKGSLPLAPEGWHMFQAPLSYLLSAPLYALLIKWLDLPSVVKIMGIIPVICGLLQIEIVYRTGRVVFSERKDLQIIAIIAGSLFPIHTYACQYVGNEPLAACLISVIIFLCISLITPDQKERGYGYFILLGFVWGLALLSKVTALLLAPVLVITIAIHTRLVQKSLRFLLRPVIIVFCVSILIAGWYYLRNYIKLGNPFAGVFETIQVLHWWQDPSYRTWSHLLSFGQALSWPVYAGVTSFWDMFYSTLWLDGLNSGLIDFLPWNENFMIAGALLGILPGMFILTALIFLWVDKGVFYRNAVFFSMVILMLFLAAMIDMYIVCPFYSRTKASYTLGLLPCYAILIAAGAEPFLRNKMIRSFTLALFACWAFAAYVAYFVIKFQ
ncbi:MAG: glycosyltransferase family 39 protein [Syntrophaceae bacterium]|nr:glycosyltransferase family 39 protein [Syntrophaceae bacterium]